MDQIKKIIIAGEGGQGIQTIAHAFAQAAFKDNLNVSFMPNYGVEQRGGVSLGFLQIGKGVIGFPKFETADILVILCERAVDRTRQYIGKNTLYIYDSDLIDSARLKAVYTEKLPIPATSYATKNLEPKVFNMIIAGAILSELESIKMKTMVGVLEEILKDKYKAKPQLRHLNKRALEVGEELSAEVYKK